MTMSAEPVWENERGTFIRVLVRPNSKSSRFVSEIAASAIVLNLSKPAREGKANTELVKKMAKILGVSTGDIMIVAGSKDREKTLLVVGTTQKDAIQKLLNMI